MLIKSLLSTPYKASNGVQVQFTQTDLRILRDLFDSLLSFI